MRTYLWLAALAIAVLFSFWYTNTGGALTEEEIALYLYRQAEAGADAEQIGRLRQFMEADNGRQFIMVNILDMNETPAVVEGAAADATADDLLGHYMEFMFPELLSRACHPIYMGEAIFSAMDIAGIENAETWDRAALMRYRSRRDLMEIATNPEFQGRHDFKVAALTKTIAFPVENALYYSDPRLLLTLLVVAICGLLDMLLRWVREAR